MLPVQRKIESTDKSNVFKNTLIFFLFINLLLANLSVEEKHFLTQYFFYFYLFRCRTCAHKKLVHKLI